MDVLLVFMFVRLGRRQDETLFGVEWLAQHGREASGFPETQKQLLLSESGKGDTSWMSTVFSLS